MSDLLISDIKGINPRSEIEKSEILVEFNLEQ
jgi:hypothetical protein